MQYTPFSKNVYITGRAVLSVICANTQYQGVVIEMFEKNKLKNLHPHRWYNQNDFLNAMAEIERKYGTAILFEMGKTVPANAYFPENINDLKSGLEAINEAYKLNHRGGEIGYYNVISVDEDNRVAEMVTYTPYPHDFDKGIITTFVRLFTQNSKVNIKEVISENKKEAKYNISW